jgi:hypothetical protein
VNLDERTLASRGWRMNAGGARRRSASEFVALIGTVVVAVATLVAVVLSFLLTELPGGSQSRFIGLTVLAGFSVVVLVWVASFRNALAYAAALISATIGTGLWMNVQFQTLHGVTFALAVSGVVMLVAVLVSQGEMSTGSKVKMRNALAAAFATTYLVTFGLVVFFQDARTELPRLTETLLSNFTLLVGGVFAFYFGGTTIEKLSELKTLRNEGTTPAEVRTVADETP